jgi:hypothetical protein
MYILLLFIVFSSGTAFILHSQWWSCRRRSSTYIESGYSEYRRRNGMDHRHSPNSTKHMEELHRIYRLFRVEKTLQILCNPDIPEHIKLGLIDKHNIKPSNISAGGLFDDFFSS